MKYIKVSLITTGAGKCSTCGSRLLNVVDKVGSSYTDTRENINNFLDMAMDGDSKYLIEVVEMTEEEFAALPEFVGF